MSPKRAAAAGPKARRRIIGYARSESSPVPRRALSPDTDRRFVQALLARGIADPRVVARLMDEHEHAKDRDDPNRRTHDCLLGNEDARRDSAGVVSGQSAGQYRP